MDMSNLSNVISKVSPIIGSALLGPFGATLTSVVANIFQSSTKPDELTAKIQTSEDAETKLKELELVCGLQTKNTAVQMALVFFPCIGVLMTTMFLFILYIAGAFSDDQVITDVLIGAESFFATLVFIVYKFYFQSNLTRFKKILGK